LKGFIHKPKKYKHAIVSLHGFPGSMIGSAKRFCYAMERKGYLCMRFEFSGTNTSEGNFEDKLMSQEVKEKNYCFGFWCW